MARNLLYSVLRTYGPSYAPEWGCGGIYGLLFTGDLIYYTVAFDAKAYFVHFDGEIVTYSFEHVGSPPRSGGDTYGASVAVDGEVYFGGWVNAPARVSRSERGVEVDFSEKYSHIHVYDVGERTVKLLWSESIHDKRRWAGEVTDLLYNPVRDSLLAARGDGHERLGVLELDRRSGRASMVSSVRVLRGAVHMDHACFTLHHGWGGLPGVHCLDLLSPSRQFTVTVRVEDASVDGGGIYGYRSGDIASAYTRLYAAVRGGILSIDPFSGEEPVFYRMMDFHYSPYGPLRSNILEVGGGLLVAFSAQSHSTVRGTDEVPAEQLKASRRPPAPTVLVYVSPPQARVVAVLGARVTSMEYAYGNVLIATSTGPNLERYDATLVDSCAKNITSLPFERLVSGQPPPLHVSVEGWVVGGNHFGGIPLAGYSNPILSVYSPKGNTLEMYFYDMLEGPHGAYAERISVESGRRETVSLESSKGLLVSFRFRRVEPKASLHVELS